MSKQLSFKPFFANIEPCKIEKILKGALLHKTSELLAPFCANFACIKSTSNIWQMKMI